MIEKPESEWEAGCERLRIPRTLEEAFGPGATLAPVRTRTHWRELSIRLLSIVLLLGCLLLLCALHGA